MQLNLLNFCHSFIPHIGNCHLSYAVCFSCVHRLLAMLKQPTITTPAVLGSSSRWTTRKVALLEGKSYTCPSAVLLSGFEPLSNVLFVLLQGICGEIPAGEVPARLSGTQWKVGDIECAMMMCCIFISMMSATEFKYFVIKSTLLY